MLLEHAPRSGLRDLGELQIGFRSGQSAAGLRQLLVDLRRLNHGQQLPGFYVRTDVEIPLLQITVGARVNRRRDERLHISRAG